jgi:hypothetical protein
VTAPGVVMVVETNCVRPVVFENDDANYRFSQRGTAFFVSYANRAFGVTAFHVVNSFRPSQYRLLRSLNGGECFNYRQPFMGNRAVDSSLYDFVVIPLVESPSEVSKEVFVWPLPDVQPAPSPGQRIWVEGFPDERRDTDYDVGALCVESGILQTCLNGQHSEAGIFQLRVTSNHALRTFSGFSGGPAYIVPQADGTMGDTEIFGIAIQGTPQSGFVYVIGILAATGLITMHLRA